jgi:beta-glucosidase
VLVLFAGAPVELPMADRLAAILTMNLPGMRGGDATAALVFGEANPSGKLAETWVRTASDSSSFDDYNRGALAQYYESVYVGYRFHDKAGTDVAFPFGFGLSYTTFEYGDLVVTKAAGVVSARFTVTNTGSRDGTEVVQLYVRSNDGAVFKPEKELRGFTRVTVPAGETVSATISFDLADLSYWDALQHDWVLENGNYEVQIAASARDIRLRSTLRIEDQSQSRSPYSSAVDAEYATPPRVIPASFSDLLGHPVVDLYDSKRLTLNTRLIDARRTVLGRILGGAIIGTVRKDYRAALKLAPSLDRDSRVKNTYFVLRMMPFSSLRSLAMSSGGAFAYELGAALELIATGHPIRGIRAIAAWRKGDR